MFSRAAFLRILDKHTSVFFLVTHRVGILDEAVRSSTDVSLYYPPLTIDATLEVFKINLQRLGDRFSHRGRRATIAVESILSFAASYSEQLQLSMRWNGRQIRNACDTALALAEAEAGTAGEVFLTANHFDIVMKAHLEFERYLQAVLAGSDGTLARSNMQRDDRQRAFNEVEGDGSDSESSHVDDPTKRRGVPPRQQLVPSAGERPGSRPRPPKTRSLGPSRRPMVSASELPLQDYILANILSSETRPVLNRVGWQSFKERRRIRAADLFAIDVLDGEPIINFENDLSESIWRVKWATSQKKAANAAADANAARVAKSGPQVPGQALLPERIRIYSKQILDVLEQIHGASMSSHDASLVMIRPFRALVHYDTPIRQKLEQLRHAARNGAAADENSSHQTDVAAVSDTGLASASGVDMDDSNGADKGTAAQTTLRQLECLVEFMNANTQAKTEYISGGLHHRITFTDVWYLFRPGDEVLEQSQRQAFRVLSVTSCHHKVVPPWIAWQHSKVERQKFMGPVITLHCVHIDFDGKKLGPVYTRFDIDKFEGEKLVKSLPVYPLRYADDSSGGLGTSREDLISRGKVFVDVIGLKPMYYSGSTLEPPEDEVESQVVIDFEEAFADRDWPGQPRLSEILGMSMRNPKDDDPCVAECCAGEQVHDDVYAETKRNEEYMARLIPDPDDKNKEASVVVVPRFFEERTVDDLSDEDFVIMSHCVYGFILHSRKWGK